MFDIIAFDADDTLWNNETHYRNTQHKFALLLQKYASEKTIDAALFATEMRNIKLLGYGVKSFTLSMIETAIQISDGTLTAQETGHILEMSRAMLEAPIELLGGVRETISRLAQVHSLMMITKGDLLDQQVKLARSGLAEFFRYFEVVSHKNAQTYADLLTRYRLDPARVIMIGNSLKSDVLPLLEIGASAVHIPFTITWEHELAAVSPDGHDGYYSLESITQLPDLLMTIMQQG